MKKLGLILGAVAMLSAVPAAAQRNGGLSPAMQAAADALGQCMVRKTTGDDRITVAGWMIAAMASAPQLAGIATVQPGKKVEMDKAMAKLFTRLITVDCPAQARVLFQSGDPAAFESAGGPLGEIAMRELLGNPAALASLAAYTNYLNEEDFKGVID